MFVLASLRDADDATGLPGAGVARGLAELVAALAEVVGVGVHHQGAAEDGVLSGQGDEAVLEKI